MMLRLRALEIRFTRNGKGMDTAMQHETLQQILELARWAPSGDNTQPWRFEIVDAQTIRIHGFDTRDHVLYDYDGRPSQIAHGALIETLRIAASGFGLRSTWRIASQSDARNPVYELLLQPEAGLVCDPLFASITTRSVQRRPMRTTALAPAHRRALTQAAGDRFSVQWFESAQERWQIGMLLWDSALIRLTCPEAYPVHKAIIEWGARYSHDRIPEQAVGVDRATARLMRFVMHSWPRVAFFNRFLMGTVVPRVQLDLLPALMCAAHLLVRPNRPLLTLGDWVETGIAWQRLWLTATQQGLQLQPEMTPVIFRWYARAGRRFSAQPLQFEKAGRLAEHFERVAHAQPSQDFAFLARVGYGRPASSRSLRQSLARLMR